MSLLTVTDFFKWQMEKLFLVVQELDRTTEKYVCCGQHLILLSGMLAK